MQVLTRGFLLYIEGAAIIKDVYSYLPTKVKEEFVKQIFDAAHTSLVCIRSCDSREQNSWFRLLQVSSPTVKFLKTSVKKNIHNDPKLVWGPKSSPFYSYRWKRGQSWPCFDTSLLALLCKSCCSYANLYFSSITFTTKGRRFVSKQGQPQPHVHSKARLLSPQL